MDLIKNRQPNIMILDGIVAYLRNLLTYKLLISLIPAIILSTSLAFLLLYFYSAEYAIPYTATLEEFTTNMPAFVLVSFFQLMLMVLFISFPLIIGYFPGYSLLNPRKLSAIYLGHFNKFSVLTIAFGSSFPGAFCIIITYLFVANFPIFPTIVLLPLVAWSAVGFIVYVILYKKKIKLARLYIKKQRLLDSSFRYYANVQNVFRLTVTFSTLWIFGFFVTLAIALGDDERHEEIVLGIWAVLIIVCFPLLINSAYIHKILPVFVTLFIAFIYFVAAPGATWHTSILMKQMNVGGQIPITVTLKPDAIFNIWEIEDKQRQLYLILLGNKNIYVSETDNYNCDEVKNYVKFKTDRCQRTYSIPMNYVQSITMYAPRRE
jgi:hypothetical protein